MEDFIRLGNAVGELLIILNKLPSNIACEEIVCRSKGVLNELLITCQRKLNAIAINKENEQSGFKVEDDVKEEVEASDDDFDQERNELVDEELDVASDTVSGAPVMISVKKKPKKRRKRYYSSDSDYDGRSEDGRYSQSGIDNSQFQPFVKNISQFPHHCVFCDTNLEEQAHHDKICHFSEDRNQYICPECDFTSDDKVSLMNHFAVNHKKKHLYYCPKCDQAYFDRRKFRVHYYLAHGGEWIDDKTCMMCLKTFARAAFCRNHMEKEHLNNMFKCRWKVCSELEFSSYADVEKHYTLEHPPIPDSCTCHICGKFFKRQYHAQYLRHVQLHTMTEKTVKCEDCGATFYLEGELTIHRRKKHLKKFMCDMCDYRTHNNVLLEKHMLTHTELRPVVCNICGLGLKDDVYLKRHMTVHSNERPHKCDFCGKGFKQRKNLTVHRKIHTGEFEGYCKICNKGFVQKYNLELHNAKAHPEMYANKKINN